MSSPLPEEVFRILLRSLDSGCLLVASAAKELADIINVGVHVCLLGTVAVEGYQHALTHQALYLLVGDEQHHAVEIQTFALREREN